MRSVGSDKTEFCLERLLPDKVYFVDVKNESSLPSDVVQFKTLARDVLFAEMMAKRCEKKEIRDGLDLLAVPLKKTIELLAGSDTLTIERYVFGIKKETSFEGQTIMLMGVADSEKTTLINAMINYLFNVDWTDSFRFQLVPSDAKSADGEKKMKVYEINHCSVLCNINNTLTIIDSPSYGDLQEKNEEITEMIRKFFNGNGTRKLNLIGFVAQSTQQCLSATQRYMLDSLVTIFGKEVMKYISFLLTGANHEDSPLLKSLTQCETNNVNHYKFDESAFFCSNGNVNEVGDHGKTPRQLANSLLKSSLWYMGLENFGSFFAELDMKEKSLSSIKKILQERKHNESIKNQLESIIKMYVMTLVETREKILFITNHQAQIEANVNVEVEMEETVINKVELPFGQYATYCNKCCVTCLVCSSETKISECEAFSSYYNSNRYKRTNCAVCPGRCLLNEHCKLPYKEEYVKEIQSTSTEAIKKMYEVKLKKQMTASELIEELKGCDVKYETCLLDCLITIRSYNCKPVGCVNQLISKEKKEKRTGFQKRIDSLKKIRLLVYINPTNDRRTRKEMASSFWEEFLDGARLEDLSIFEYW